MNISAMSRLKLAVALFLFTGAALPASAATMCTANSCTVTIAGDPNAATSNFQNPGTTATVGYTIVTNDDGTNFNVVLTTIDPNALPFANLYFDTIASTPNTGSNLGFEFGQNSEDAFDPDSGTKYNLAGTGVTSTIIQNANGTLATVVIPNSLFLTNPLGMPFANTPAGTLVSLHLSQSFGYSVVGGGANYPAPVELGDAVVGAASPVPEPSSLVLLSTGMFCILGVTAKKSIG